MNILALNCGSTSLKFRVASLTDAAKNDQHQLASGVVDSIGPGAHLEFHAETGAHLLEQRPLESLGDAAIAVLDWLEAAHVPSLDAVGHRVVHGGAAFQGPVRITADTIEQLDRLSELAPLHNGPAMQAIRSVDALIGNIPSVATFDTTFHAHMPERAALYALPLDLMRRHAIRRYGFHGLAHRSMLYRYASLAAKTTAEVSIITLQLGGGCSIAAIERGSSIDTSMGFTPLEGLMMGTRSGDLDPSLPAYIAEHEGLTPDWVDDLLNRDSGLKGVSGRSGDVRELLRAESEGDERSTLALDMFCYRIRKAIGAYLAALGGAQAIVFGGGIGEHSATIRERICRGMKWSGVALDADRNNAATGEARISADISRVALWVIPSDEESVILSDTYSCVSGSEGPVR
jgi:acetate kinase